MFRLDDKFLQELGLESIPEDQKKAFLEQVYSSLEERVGTKLSEGLSDNQLEEFESIIDRDEAKVDSWLDKHAKDYVNDTAFKRLQEASKLDPSDPALKSEYAATRWLEVNRPNYRDVVSDTMESLKVEIKQNRDAILDSIK